MKNIKSRHLEKYNTDNYEELAFSVFKNKVENNYCFTFEAEFEELEGQYPLSDLLSQYGLNCTDYYLTNQNIDGVKKSIIEVETLDDEKVELIHILNFSTIVGRIVENVIFCNTVLLVLNNGIGKILFKESETFVPIYAKRTDRKGMLSFEIIYPEIQYKKIFELGVQVEELIPPNSRIRFILIEESLAFIIYIDNEVTKKLIYSLKGYESDEILGIFPNDESVNFE